MSSLANPIDSFLAAQGFLLLDGGLATTLESHGYDLRDELWSARLLLEDPQALVSVHREFLEAGADCIASASYQASLPGFAKRGLSDEEGLALLERSVLLAREARDAFWAEPHNRVGRLRPLVAASIGPYGAYLADGSEYSGRYGVGDDALEAFHRPRWECLARSGADLLACETVPSGQECEVLLRLLRETPGVWAWLSFSCRDGRHLCDGALVGEVASACDDGLGVAGVGVNCSAPELVPDLIAEMRGATGHPVLVYPNRGERYDATLKSWGRATTSLEPERLAPEWVRLGAAGVGGCCRVGPAAIRAMRRGLEG